MGEQKKFIARKKMDKKHKKAINKSAKYGSKKGKINSVEELSAGKNKMQGKNYTIK